MTSQLIQLELPVTPVLLWCVGVLLLAFRTHTVLLGFFLLGLALFILSLFIFIVERDLNLWLLQQSIEHLCKIHMAWVVKRVIILTQPNCRNINHVQL